MNKDTKKIIMVVGVAAAIIVLSVFILVEVLDEYHDRKEQLYTDCEITPDNCSNNNSNYAKYYEEKKALEKEDNDLDMQEDLLEQKLATGQITYQEFKVEKKKLQDAELLLEQKEDELEQKYKIYD